MHGHPGELVRHVRPSSLPPEAPERALSVLTPTLTLAGGARVPVNARAVHEYKAPLNGVATVSRLVSRSSDNSIRELSKERRRASSRNSDDLDRALAGATPFLSRPARR